MSTSRWNLNERAFESILEASRESAGESLWRDAWRRLRINRIAYISLLFLVAVVLVSALAPLLPLPSPMELDLKDEPQAPTWPWHEVGNAEWDAEAYWELNPIDDAMQSARAAVFGEWQTGPWLGTDSKGRDMLSRIVWGSRISIQVALAATLCSLVIGAVYGALAGYLGGRVDNLMMRFVDVLYSIPFIFLVIFLIGIVNEYRADLAEVGIDHMTVFYAVIGMVYWLTMARVVRGQVLALRSSEFIEAARVLGASTPRILFAHLLPNVLSVVIVYLTLTIPAVMLFEAFLSFLGLGVEPPKVSWGLLAVDGTEAINPVRTYWWLVAWPAAAMGSTLLALNLLGDGLRDALDPKLRGAGR